MRQGINMSRHRAKDGVGASERQCLLVGLDGCGGWALGGGGYSYWHQVIGSYGRKGDR